MAERHLGSVSFTTALLDCRGLKRFSPGTRLQSDVRLDRSRKRRSRSARNGVERQEDHYRFLQPACFGMEGVDRSVRCGVERKVKSGARGRHRKWLLLECQKVSAAGWTV